MLQHCMYIHTFALMPPSLETEIKQKEFANPYVKLMVNLIYTGTWMKNIHSELLKPHKLTGAQFNVLRILQGQHPQPASVNLIIDRMLDKNSNASRLVDKLLEKELVERSVCASDRRKVEVRISTNFCNRYRSE